jgi:hypothetical protein
MKRHLLLALLLVACEEAPQPGTAASSPAPSSPDVGPGDPSSTPPSPDVGPGDPSSTPSNPDGSPGGPSSTPSNPDGSPGDPSSTPSSPDGSPGDPSSTPQSPDASPRDASPAPPPDAAPAVPVVLDPGDTADLVPAAPTQPPPPPPPPRARRRMNLDQLDQAMRQVSGGIGWTERRGNADVNLFVDLAATLGKPDYIQTTSESLEPSALFLKFLDDAARSVCAKMIERDLAAGGPGVLLHDVGPDDTIDANEAAVRANLAYLLDRFHGRRDADDVALASWRWLFVSASFVGGDPLTGWDAVCVGLFTHPDFYSY